MRRRQRNKNDKKYLTVILDESALLLMTEEEHHKAIEGYEVFRKKYAFRKKYKDLKSRTYLVYIPPVGRDFREVLLQMVHLGRKKRDLE